MKEIISPVDSAIRTKSTFQAVTLYLLGVLVLYFSLDFLQNWYWRMNLVVGSMTQEVNLNPKSQAPELEGGLEWFNIDAPLRLEQLRGKIVLLDFWTYCCINCLHIIPDLKRLEADYPEELLVIGVHSGKFDNERESENIRQAILRYGIEHPVVNDAHFAIWRQYGARGWPHLVLIDPDGMIVAEFFGEGHYLRLDRAIRQLIQTHDDNLDRTPIALALERDKRPRSALSFPGKVLADEESDRLFIADTGYNRIVITDFAGNVIDIAGEGVEGWRDGAFESARFRHPHGMALDGDSLYIADTGNHMLRRLDLAQRSVTTVAGTGRQSYTRRGGGPARETGLNSPWDLTQMKPGGPIYIAMAGSHQLWVYDPRQGRVETFAGTGREDIIDLIVTHAALAQPSGITHDGQQLYFADSETSALRMIDFRTDVPLVRTLIGKGLFDFGDRDGPFENALMQHAMCAQYLDGVVYIADAYNHKIKAADLSARVLTTLAGTGAPGLGSENEPQFNEPSGLSAAKGKLFVADTNNHAIRVIDLDHGVTSTLNIDHSTWKRRQSPRVFDPLGQPNTISLEKPLAPDANIVIRIDFPEGYTFNEMANPLYQFRVHTEQEEWIGERLEAIPMGTRIPLRLNELPSDADSIEIAVTYFYCRADHQGQCFIGSLRLEGTVNEIDGEKQIEVRHAASI